MGLNIYIQRPSDYGDHPDWDWMRHAGDREFAATISGLPRDTKGPSGYGDDWLFIRPTDFQAWRGAVAKVEWANPGRYDHMLDILERNPDYWIYLSY